MDDILLVCCWLFIALLIHVVLYRLFIRWKFILVALGSIYFFGIPILIVKHIYVPLPGVHFFITACLLSLISSLIAVLFYLPRLLEGQTPATILLGAFSTRKLWKKKELFDLFSERDLIDKRLQTLKEKNLIREEHKVFYITWKGVVAYALILFSLKVTGMEVGG